MLTQGHIEFNNAIAAYQHITWEKIHPSHISYRQLWIPTLSIMLYVIHRPSQGGDHAEHAVPENPESVIYLILSSQNSFLC